eukprot:9574705-Alexandrium_andersonii.AAC.1
MRSSDADKRQRTVTEAPQASETSRNDSEDPPRRPSGAQTPARPTGPRAGGETRRRPQPRAAP